MEADFRRSVPLIGAALALLLGAPAAADGQDAPYWRGKTIAVFSGTSAAGAYTSYARILAAMLPRYLPGSPTSVVKFMPAASGLALANWLYGVAAKDGLNIAVLPQRMAIEPLVAPDSEAKFDGRKFTWLGSMGKLSGICFTWRDSKVRTLEEATRMPITVGSDNAQSPDGVMPAITNAVAGTKFRIINGYEGNAIYIAMERGEVEGRCGVSWESLQSERPDWVRGRLVHVLVQFSLAPLPGLAGVPLLIDGASSEEDKRALRFYFAPGEMGRPFAAPPDLPPERTAELRQAFMRAVADPEAREMADKQHLDINPISGEAVQKIVTDLYAAPPTLMKRIEQFRALGAAEGEKR